MARCQGTPEQHCCWIDGLECPFLVKTATIDCGLRSELKTWPAVYLDTRYQQIVQPTFDRLAPGKGCGDWPLDTCAACGVKGNG